MACAAVLPLLLVPQDSSGQKSRRCLSNTSTSTNTGPWGSVTGQTRGRSDNCAAVESVQGTCSKDFLEACSPPSLSPFMTVASSPAFVPEEFESVPPA
eukprot:scaffold204338_cov17-Prasinocladus_malaysianus.AAC.2